MSLPVMLAANFALSEFVRASRGAWPPSLDAKAQAVASLLQQVRNVLGRPMTVTSFYREGDPHQHGRASAADFVVTGMRSDEIGRAIIAARARGEVGAYGQLIVYPYTTNHVHISLPEPQIQSINRNLVKVANGYAAWAGGDLPPNSSGAIMLDDPDPAGAGAPSSALGLGVLALLFAAGS